ncbi:MAG: sugar ABC transporter ATP-binding protein [Actinobacteria bacterium]|nr:sugar ABC transporter ATP-binding protein [Actinomycetota bacterium]
MPGGLTVEGLSKTFAGQRALDDVSTSFPAGEITALLGHNGSGKSTLIKIFAGFYEPDEARTVTVFDRELSLPLSPRQAHEAGLRFMHQDLALVDDLTIADNFAFVDHFRTRTELGPISKRREHRRVAEVLATFGVGEDPGRRVGELDTTTKTIIGMARAVQDSRTSRDDTRHHVLFLDEPTAALPQDEVERVLEVMRAIRDRGGAVVLVSHRIDEVMRIADRVVVLRDGRVVAERKRAGLDPDGLVELIVGGSAADEGRRAKAPEDEVTLSVRGLRGPRLRGIDFEVRRGEIVGIAGLVGCGRSELARILAGAQRAEAGTCTLAGEPFEPKTPSDALRAGVSYVPQDRRGAGCITAMSLQENLSLGLLNRFFTGGWLNLREERRSTRDAIKEFGIRPPDPRRLVAYFSGGNQQKAVVSRAVRRDPTLLVLDEPMQGIDIGAKREIAQIVRNLADEGVSVVVGSTDAADLVGLCERVLVLNRGELVAIAKGVEVAEERLTLLAANPDSEEEPDQ